MSLVELGQKAKAASRVLGALDTNTKNQVLLACADALESNISTILEENQKDMDLGREKNMPEHMQDRLLLNEARIKDMANGLREVAALQDPVGSVISMNKRPNGLLIGQKRVPIGVIGIIYEARPNVTSDAFGLCFKTGNAVILRGGSDAINSNKAICKVLRDAMKSEGIPEDGLLLIEDTTHEGAKEFMRLNGYVDVLIPRGSANLIQTVVQNSTVPVIETGSGNCHVYVDRNADIQMAIDIILNAKTQRLSVCNACESIVIHEDIAKHLIPEMSKQLVEKEIELRCDDNALEIAKDSVKDHKELLNMATEEDWGTEYLDKIVSIKTVKSIDEAIEHINKYNTGHSETIVTKDYDNARKFLNLVDAACVYVNASTRFTDGFEFGFGAEIGISTQKLHARGPMGLLALTSYKYIIYGEGQVRK